MINMMMIMLMFLMMITVHMHGKLPLEIESSAVFAFKFLSPQPIVGVEQVLSFQNCSISKFLQFRTAPHLRPKKSSGVISVGELKGTRIRRVNFSSWKTNFIKAKRDQQAKINSASDIWCLGYSIHLMLDMYEMFGASDI